MMSRWVKVTQVFLGIVAAVLVASLFFGGMIGGQSRDPQATPKPSGAPSAAPLPEGSRLPGEPERPIAEHDLLPAVVNISSTQKIPEGPEAGPVPDRGGAPDTSTRATPGMRSIRRLNSRSIMSYEPVRSVLLARRTRSTGWSVVENLKTK